MSWSSDSSNSPSRTAAGVPGVVSPTESSSLDTPSLVATTKTSTAVTAERVSARKGVSKAPAGSVSGATRDALGLGASDEGTLEGFNPRRLDLFDGDLLESAMKEKLRAKEREMDACICRRKICHDQENMYRIGVGLKETHRSTKKNVNFRGGPKREPRSKHRMVANQRKKKHFRQPRG